MRDDLFRNHPTFNSPAEMRRRGAIVTRFVAGLAGLILVAAGASVGNGERLLLGLGLIGSAVLTANLTARRNEVGEIEEEPEMFGEMAEVGREVHLERLIALLWQWDALEQRRGQAGFDPWAAQSLRHDIRELIASDASLTWLLENRGSGRDKG